MSRPAPKNRLGIISPGIGKLASAVTFLLIGVVMMFFNRQIGQSLMLMALIFGVWGIYTIYRGVHAPHKNVVCPHCGQTTEVLSKVREFNCSSCGKAVKLVRKPSK